MVVQDRDGRPLLLTQPGDLRRLVLPLSSSSKRFLGAQPNDVHAMDVCQVIDGPNVIGNHAAAFIKLVDKPTHLVLLVVDIARHHLGALQADLGPRVKAGDLEQR